MGMSLNEHLAEVDRWKQEVADQLSGLSAQERQERDRQAVEWLEREIGMKLPQEPPRPRSEPAPQ